MQQEILPGTATLRDLASATPQELPAPVQALPLACLQLEASKHDALIMARITTVGELHRMNPPICELSANSLAEINAALLNLLHALNQANEVN